jgi:hypothetical protein
MHGNQCYVCEEKCDNLLNIQLVSALPKQHANIKSLVRDSYVKGEMCKCQFSFSF